MHSRLPRGSPVLSDSDATRGDLHCARDQSRGGADENIGGWQFSCHRCGYGFDFSQLRHEAVHLPVSGDQLPHVVLTMVPHDGAFRSAPTAMNAATNIVGSEGTVDAVVPALTARGLFDSAQMYDWRAAQLMVSAAPATRANRALSSETVRSRRLPLSRQCSRYNRSG